jgi:CheY-like chemotaxis protein
MANALICSESTFDSELAGTLLWRSEVERRVAQSADEALAAARALKPDIVVLDRDLPQGARLVSELRRDLKTRRVSVVVIARTDFEAVEVDLLEAGANAVLRLPATPEWDDRLVRLVAVPARREVRLPVHLELEASTGAGIHVTVATALNLSESGVLIETDVELHVGDDLDLRLHLPEAASTVIGCGRVVRHAGRHRYGVEFYGLEGDGPDLVRQYVSRVDIPGRDASQL